MERFNKIMLGLLLTSTLGFVVGVLLNIWTNPEYTVAGNIVRSSITVGVVALFLLVVANWDDKGLCDKDETP